ncbi:thiolase family protein [soil metagenome]
MSKPQAAIVGIGTVGFGDFSSESGAAISDRALSAALQDAGLERSDLDGLLIHIGSPRGLDFDEMARLLNLRVGFASQTWSHGRFAATLIQHAAMAVMQGLCSHAVCIATFRNSPFSRHGTVGFPGWEENFREGGGPHAEQPHSGLIAPIGGAAMSTQRYMHRFGIDRDKLAAVAIAQRNGASKNPMALRRAPITMQQYVDSPYVVEPLRLLDCSSPVDTSVAVIITTADRARDLEKRPVHLKSFQGMSAGPSEFVFGQPGLGINQRDAFDYRPEGAREKVFRDAGLLPADIDTFHCYDGFSPQVLWTLERFGFAAPGDAADWIQHGRIELGGELPVNTSGGHLSEGHSNGWGQTLEIVRQLRGEAGERQIEDCRHALWATTFGDAVIYAND